jgi:hypothetical protein
MTHGTTTCYVTHKCRCEACGEAWRAYWKAYAAKRKAIKAEASARVERGEIPPRGVPKRTTSKRAARERRQRWWKRFWATAP